MFRHPKLGLSLLGLAILLHLSSTVPARAQEPDSPVKIGMVESLFTDVNPAMVRIGSIMFAALMKTSTGMDGEMVTGGDPMTVAKNLSDGKLDLAVFHGVEFAWVQKRFPALRPLMVAITKYGYTQAHIVVLKDGPISTFANLQGKPFVMPLCSREHCRLFLDKCCTDCGCDGPQRAFSEVFKVNGEQALDDVCQGKASATVVDKVALEHYQALKPGCFARLQILKTSEEFPTGVIVYRIGSLGQDKLSRFRAGLMTADKTDLGREMMKGFRITSFEAVPENYAQMLSDILKVYPAPAVVAPK